MAEVTVCATFAVDVEFSNQSGVSRFGNVETYEAAERLHLTLSARSDVKKATIIRIIEGA